MAGGYLAEQPRLVQSQAFIVAHTYEQLLRDLKEGTSVVPSWEHAVHRHTSIQLSG